MVGRTPESPWELPTRPQPPGHLEEDPTPLEHLGTKAERKGFSGSLLILWSGPSSFRRKWKGSLRSEGTQSATFGRDINDRTEIVLLKDSVPQRPTNDGGSTDDSPPSQIGLRSILIKGGFPRR